MRNEGRPERGGWTAVQECIDGRLREMRLRWNLAQVHRESGVSDATWRKLLKGEPISRRDKLDQVCDFLGWTPDSIERILAGGEPVSASTTAPEVGSGVDRRAGPVDRRAPTGLEAVREELQAELATVRAGMGQMEDRIREMDGRMAMLERMADGILQPGKGRRQAGGGGRS